MSYLADWAVLAILYTCLHFVFLNVLSPGMLEILASREYAPALLVTVVFAVVNCLQTFAAAISTALFARWWLHPDIPSILLLLAAILPGLIILQLLRFAGESGLVGSVTEMIVNLCMTLLVAYAAVLLGLRLTLA
jgi:hypothetical protein